MENNKMTTKKALLIVGGLIVAIGITLVIPAKWFGIEQIAKKQTKIEITSPSFLRGSVTDTDKDNVISWKELITSSLPEQDLVEAKEKTADPEVIKQLNDPANLTASFSKNLYITSAALADKGSSGAEEEQEILNQLIAQEASKIIPTTFTHKSLNVDKSETKTSIKAYGNELAKILDGIITKKSIADDFNALQAFINTQDPQNLTPLTKDYQKMDVVLQKLQAVSVPVSASAYHLLALNRIGAYRDLLYNLSVASSDPIRARLVVDKIPTTLVSTLRIYIELSTYFNLQNVVFSSQEAGYMFTVGYTIK